MLVLEEAEFAKSRGATILAEIVGVGESNNLNAKYECLEAGAVNYIRKDTPLNELKEIVKETWNLLKKRGSDA